MKKKFCKVCGGYLFPGAHHYCAALVLLAVLSGCAASHGGADCVDAAQRLQELSCVEGYATEAEFAPVCAVIDADCVVEASSCTEARVCRR